MCHTRIPGLFLDTIQIVSPISTAFSRKPLPVVSGYYPMVVERTMITDNVGGVPDDSSGATPCHGTSKTAYRATDFASENELGLESTLRGNPALDGNTLRTVLGPYVRFPAHGPHGPTDSIEGN